MKKILLALMGVVALALVSCTTLPAPTNLQVVKPAYVQRIETFFEGLIEIKRWEENGHTLWLWVDNKNQPRDCDYVIVYGIVDLENDEYVLLSVINSTRFEDPCAKGDEDFKEYTKLMAEAAEIADDLEDLSDEILDHSANPMDNEI